MRRIFFVPMLWLCQLALQTPAYAAISLEPFEQEFKMSLSSFRVTATRSLNQLDDGRYEFRLYAKNMIARYEEKSIFMLGEGDQILPLEHSVSSKVFGVSRSEKTLFNWEIGQATYTRKDRERTAEIVPGILDRALYQLLIPQDLLAGRTDLSYEFLDRGRLKTYEFAIVEEEQIELVDTEVNAVRMNRTNQDDDNRETDIWLALDHDYELVKISHTDEDGSDYHMLLKGEL